MDIERSNDEVGWERIEQKLSGRIKPLSDELQMYFNYNIVY